MKVTDTRLTDVKIVKMDVFGDHRGFSTGSYSKVKFAEHELDYSFTQDNHSLSVKASVLWGLHFQKGEAMQIELVRVVAGAVLDVMMNIRKGSPTYGQWNGFILSEHNHRQLLVPKGYTHGFITSTPNMNFLYKCDNYYNAEADGGIVFNDLDLAIDWPVDPSRAIMSEKDHRHPTLGEFGAENPSVYGEV